MYLRYTVPIVKLNSWFFVNVVFGVLDCVHSFWMFLYIFGKCRPMSPKPNYIPFKMTLRAVQSIVFELCSACFSLVRGSRDQSSWSNTCFGCDISCFFCFSNVNPLQNLRSAFGQCVWSFLGRKIWEKTSFNIDAFFVKNVLSSVFRKI